MIILRIPKGKQGKFYVLYKGDNIICSGTFEEILQKTGMTVDYLSWLTTGTAQRREAASKGNRMIMVEG